MEKLLDKVFTFLRVFNIDSSGEIYSTAITYYSYLKRKVGVGLSTDMAFDIRDFGFKRIFRNKSHGYYKDLWQCELSKDEFVTHYAAKFSDPLTSEEVKTEATRYTLLVETFTNINGTGIDCMLSVKIWLNESRTLEAQLMRFTTKTTRGEFVRLLRQTGITTVLLKDMDKKLKGIL